MKRSVYEAPVTDRFQIELEGVFMSASIVHDKNTDVETTGHELNVVDLDLVDADWNTGTFGDDANDWK